MYGLIYVLVLGTQLPHVWHAYAALEQEGWALARATAIGAAVAFELATGIFTWRIVRGSRRRWTRRGLAFFIVASIVANGFYYELWPTVFDRLMPAFATLALPIALALFAEEFGAEQRLEERREKRRGQRVEREAEREATEAPALYRCPHPGCNAVFPSQQALAGHANAHRNGRERMKAHL